MNHFTRHSANISKLRSRGQWRSGRVVALLFLGLSSGAVPLRLTTAGQSGTKNHYMLPLDLGDDWNTNVTIIKSGATTASLQNFIPA